MIVARRSHRFRELQDERLRTRNAWAEIASGAQNDLQDVTGLA
jgi:hypothetical protein